MLTDLHPALVHVLEIPPVSAAVPMSASPAAAAWPSPTDDGRPVKRFVMPQLQQAPSLEVLIMRETVMMLRMQGICNARNEDDAPPPLLVRCARNHGERQRSFLCLYDAKCVFLQRLCCLFA